MATHATPAVARNVVRLSELAKVDGIAERKLERRANY